MKRMTIGLLGVWLGAGLLLGARAQEKPAAAGAKDAAATANTERPLALPWTALREPFSRPQTAPWLNDDKEHQDRFKRAYAEITKREGEVYRQIEEGKVDEAFPTVFDLFVMVANDGFLTTYARGGKCEPYFEARFKEVLGEAGMKQLAAERRRVEDAIEKYRQEAIEEYEPVLKAGIEANPEWAVAERRIKEATAKLETQKVNIKGEPKDSSRKLTAEETAAAAVAAKEYKVAEGAVRRFRDAFNKDPENKRLQQAAENALSKNGPYHWMMLEHGPFLPYRALLTRERQVIKFKLGWHGAEWLLLGPDPAPDPALPRIDESGRKPGTAKVVDLGNNVKLEFVWIPPGEYLMGSPMNEPGRDVQERLHRVKLTKGFWMGKYEVTQEQWQCVMGNNPSWFQKAGPRAPVETVRWDQAKKFLRKLGEMTAGKDNSAGGKFRLPTEAEWEWACRAGTDKASYNGKVTIQGANNGPELDAIAWYGGNSGVAYEGGVLSAHWPAKQHDHRLAGTHPVGGKQPNAWGLYDMLGNVWEWCENKHSAYPSQAVTDPTGEGKNPDSMGGVVRGGAWNSYVRLCRSASRDWTYSRELWRNPMIGFRVVMDESPTEKAK
ncbi:MAG: formylglycine-generating enzyme family protein [Planctomycetota bacterium]